MFNLLTKIYKELNPDILAGINEHLKNVYDIENDVFYVISEYCKKCPDNEDIKKECRRLNNSNSIADLESYYELIDYLMEAIS